MAAVAGQAAPNQSGKQQDVQSTPSKWDQVRSRSAHYAGLVLASMIGCLIRLGLDAMAAYDGQIIFELAWAQGVGCGIMGLALYRKAEITDLYAPLYTFITVGIAGSVTTFSAWMLGGYESFSNFYGYRRSGFHSLVDGFGYTFATFAIAIGCLYWGEHVSQCLPSLVDISNRRRRPDKIGPLEELPAAGGPYATDVPPQPDTVTSADEILGARAEMMMDFVFIASAAASYLIALLLYFLGPAAWRHRATFPILLSPPGAILRFYLSNFNSWSKCVGRFPIGTFAANIIGSLITGGSFAGELLPSSKNSAVQCNALWAIHQGFCGCLTTVSTFVVESRSIKTKRWTWVYVGSSIILGHICILVTLGAARWAGGLEGSSCSA